VRGRRRGGQEGDGGRRETRAGGRRGEEGDEGRTETKTGGRREHGEFDTAPGRKT